MNVYSCHVTTFKQKNETSFYRLNYRVQIRVFTNSVIPEHKNKIRNEFLRFFFVLVLHNGLCFIYLSYRERYCDWEIGFLLYSSNGVQVDSVCYICDFMKPLFPKKPLTSLANLRLLLWAIRVFLKGLEYI